MSSGATAWWRTTRALLIVIIQSSAVRVYSKHGKSGEAGAAIQLKAKLNSYKSLKLTTLSFHMEFGFNLYWISRSHRALATSNGGRKEQAAKWDGYEYGRWADASRVYPLHYYYFVPLWIRFWTQFTFFTTFSSIVIVIIVTRSAHELSAFAAITYVVAFSLSHKTSIFMGLAEPWTAERAKHLSFGSSA